jgi:hypothetical protein
MLKTVILVKILKDTPQVLQECLKQLPFVEVISSQPSPDFPGHWLVLRVQGRESKLLTRAQVSGQPRLARQAVYELKAALEKTPIGYGVFIAPYISPQSAVICQEAGIGYFDQAGNCHLAFGSVYIHKEGIPNPFVAKRDLRSIYSSKAERILRVLLSAPRKTWKTQELADAAQVSLGQVANIKKLLTDKEWLKADTVGMALTNPTALLDEWAGRYDFRRNQTLEIYTLDDVVEAEYKFGEACQQLDIQYALTGFSAASRIAPMVRYQRMSAYLDGDVEILLDKLGWKQVNSGANVSLLLPYDDGVFYNAQPINGVQIASLVQIYLDLQNSRGRGQEAADAVRKEILKTW